ncbi:Glu-tRNA(Gln) amidotransferase GatDE subunit E [Candidatus Pacearchaeota archaeon]|nr:Glu-tRNA(Gln) amidotransferase GatDE subunit E [Candidatus Pacearchaeota archaeon]|tara:strand:+ start:12108 stop:13907 length:1800 start_codon:yes stop_codon:yes gene_type:complete
MKEELKAGLEIHQQLDTHKLFCKCPSLLRNDEPKLLIERELNPVVGETGKIDTAAAFEKLKDKTFHYQFFDTNCLVEIDEEPPHGINQEALRIALQIAHLLNAKIFPVSQIMRKTVIDGSNTSGFQRTVLIAHDGHIETSQGKVRIETIALEEDAARKKEDSHGKRVYSLDRLGIPLVEITTKPDLKNPEQIKEAALKIGEILRACQVKRGLGTIRQDVNISIPKGQRVEIKGFQDPKIMVSTVLNEVERQKKILEIKSDLKKIKVDELTNLKEHFEETDCNLLKEKPVFGFKLTNAKGIIGKELQPDKRIGTDLSEYAKPVSGIGGIIHSDENLDKYELKTNEIKNVIKTLGVGKQDAFIIITTSKEYAEKAHSAIKQRLNLLGKGVPKEVRRSNPDSTTTFLRPMPGAARMYPETDCELLRIKKQLMDETKKNLPKLASENKRYLQEYGLNDELVKVVLKQNKLQEFKELTNVTDHYDSIAKSLTLFPIELARKQNQSKKEIGEILNLDVLAAVLEKVGNDITPNDLKGVLEKIVQGENIKDALKRENIDLDKIVKDLISEKPGLSIGAYMGLIMGKYKGQVSGNELMDSLKKNIDL